MEKLTPAQRRVIDALLHYKGSILKRHTNNFGTKCYRLVAGIGDPIMNFRLDIVDRLIEKGYLTRGEVFRMLVALSPTPPAEIPQRRKPPKLETHPLRRAHKKSDPEVTRQQSFDFEKKKSRIYVQMPRGK